MPKVVALYSSAMQSGKTTAAEVFMQYGYIRVRFAEALKKMVDTMLYECGISVEMRVRYIDGNLKEEIIPELGCTTRYLMQTLGTEWGRQLVNDNIWVNITKEKIKHLVSRGYSVVIDDLRYQNEAAMLYTIFDATIYEIFRPGQKDTTGHSSEGALKSWMMDDVISNDGTLSEFKQKILSLL